MSVPQVFCLRSAPLRGASRYRRGHLPAPVPIFSRKKVPNVPDPFFPSTRSCLCSVTFSRILVICFPLLDRGRFVAIFFTFPFVADYFFVWLMVSQVKRGLFFLSYLFPLRIAEADLSKMKFREHILVGPSLMSFGGTSVMIASRTRSSPLFSRLFFEIDQFVYDSS